MLRHEGIILMVDVDHGRVRGDGKSAPMSFLSEDVAFGQDRKRRTLENRSRHTAFQNNNFPRQALMVNDHTQKPKMVPF
jgi:hypothetical protein